MSLFDERAYAQGRNAHTERVKETRAEDVANGIVQLAIVAPKAMKPYFKIMANITKAQHILTIIEGDAADACAVYGSRIPRGVVTMDSVADLDGDQHVLQEWIVERKKETRAMNVARVQGDVTAMNYHAARDYGMHLYIRGLYDLEVYYAEGGLNPQMPT